MKKRSTIGHRQLFRTAYRRPLQLAISSVLALGASATYAGEPAGSGAVLEEIIVTAEFREASLQETPVAITAVTGDMLEARSQTSIEQVAAQAPNVHLGPQGQANGSGMIAFIRGVGQTDFNFALEPGVGLYIDDVYYPTLTGSLVDMLDLDRVEILRGPQGTLAGRNSIGGAIKMFSKKPTGEGGSVSLTYGSFDRVDARATADFTVVEDKFYARIAAVTKNRDGFVDRYDYGCTHPGSGIPTYNVGMGCKIGTLGGIAYNAGRLSMRWIASDSLEVNVIGDVTNDNSEAGADVLRRVNPSVANGGTSTSQPVEVGGVVTSYDCRFVPYGPYSCDPNQPNDPYMSYANFLDTTAPNGQHPFKPIAVPPIQALDQYGLSATIDWTISDDFSLKSITAWREYDSSWAQDADGSPVASQQLLQTLEHEQWSQELRLNGSLFGDAIDFTLGGFYFEQDGTLEARVDLPYAGIDFIHGPDTTPSDSTAVFLHTTWHMTDALNLSAGVRYSEDNKDYTYFRRNPDHSLPQPCTGFPFGPDQPPNCVLAGLYDISDSFSGTRTDWRVALDYQWTDNFMTYAQVSTGYKGGGVNPRPFFGPSSGIDDVTGLPRNQLKSFDPETLTTYEVGFKSDLFDNSLRVNMAAFYNEYEDIILTLPRCPTAPCLQPNNVGAAEVQGVELETVWIPTEGLAIDASASWLDFEYTTTGDSGVPLDNVTPFTPEIKWAVGIQYDFDMGDSGNLIARVDGSYQDEVYSSALNAETNLIPDYTLVNARLTWRSESTDWETSLEVTNVTDEVYYVFNFDQAASSGTTSYTPGMPAVWALTIKRNF